MSTTRSYLEEEKDETFRKNFRNMTLSFHGDSSQGTYSPSDMMSKPEGSVYGPKGSVASCVICKTCSKLHPPYASCVDWNCWICCKVHNPWSCPALDSIPQGAPYNHGNFEIFCCLCGHLFNEDKWFCTHCGQTEARLARKCCFTCLKFDHSDYECPKDKVYAARIKAYRDERLSRVPVSKPPAPSIKVSPSASGEALLKKWEQMGIIHPRKVTKN